MAGLDPPRPGPLVVSRQGPGAYGLRFVADEPHLQEALVTAPESWPTVSLEQRLGTPPPATPEPGSERGRVPLLGGGHALLDRRRRSVTLLRATPVDADILVHPTLSLVSAVFSTWLGRHAIHAAGFIVNGGAWALIGDSRAGKTSTLAWLAQAGHDVLADDLVVIEGGTAFAGPRTLDLVPSTARYLGSDGRPVRGGERRRLALENIEPEVPFRGWFALSWGAAVEARRLSPGDRLGVLVENLPIRLDGPGYGALLDLTGRPGFELRRPKRLEALPHAGAKIVEVATSV